MAMGSSSPDEMVDAVQSHESHDNKVDSDDVIQQPRNKKDQYPCDESDNRRDMGGSEMHNELRIG
jgi:hypothetical protein